MKFLTENLSAKIIALLIALVAWTYVASGESRMINIKSIPVDAKATGEGLIAKLGEQDVDIKVSVDKSKIKNLTSEMFEAHVDLAGKTKGTYLDVPVVVTSRNINVTVTEVTPSTITVMLDPAITKTVPVAVKIDGKPGDGLAPDDPIIEPDKVEVRGAKTDVDRVMEATAELSLKGEISDVKKTIALKGHDAKGENIRSLAFSPMEVSVTVPIVKAGKSKTVGIKVQTVGFAKAGYWISQIAVEPSVISITGNADALADTKYIETNKINIDGLNANKTFTTDITIPTGIVLIDPIESVRVIITVSSADTTKEVIAGFNSINLSQTLRLNTTDTEPVKVLVSGPGNKLETLTGNDVTVTLDLNAFKSPTSTKIDIAKEWIKVPEGITVIRYNPSAVTITLESRSD